MTYTSAETTGSIKFTPTSNRSGNAVITVTVEDGGLDGMVAQVEKARPRSILDPALETADEVFFSDGEFNSWRKGYARNAAEIVANVQQLVDSVSRLEDW